uniref:Uncharacterized protein n=1 Tax=Arundo donax TaxID=35708 RepID=A0A0A9G747_ARUDO
MTDSMRKHQLLKLEKVRTNAKNYLANI